MKKLLLLTLTCAYGISMYAMELTESDSDLMVFMKEPIPVAIKSDKQPRTSALLQQEIDRLSSAIAETKITYEETKKKGKEAQKRTRMPDQIFNGGWSKDDLTEFDCKEKCQKLHELLKEMEQERANIKYQLFRNHIKHSHPTKLKSAIPNAVGCFDRIVYNLAKEEVSYPEYCLFTQEQKMDLVAYAQTIVPKRFEAVQGARDNEDMFAKPYDPKVREKHEKACQVVLLMKEFKKMSFNRQQSFSDCLTYKSS